MNLEEMMEKLEEIYPDGFSIDEDDQGELVIHSRLRMDENGGEELLPFVEDDEDDEEEEIPDEPKVKLLKS